MDKRPAAVAVFGFLVSGAVLFWAFSNVDIGRAREALTEVEVWPWIPLAVLCYAIGHGVRGWRCARLVREDAPLPVTTATNVVVVGYAVNNLLPARLGEFARAGLLAERAGLSLVQALSVTFLERLIDGLVVLLYFAAATALLDLSGPLNQVHWEILAVFLVASAGLAVVVLVPDRVTWMVSRLAPPRLRSRLVDMTIAALRGVSYLRKPAHTVEIIIMTLMVWAFDAAMFLCVMLGFGLPANPLWGLVVMAIVNLGILLPSSPGFVGTFHFFAMQALVALGVPEPVALGYAFVAHLTFYIPITLWGVGAMLWYGVRLGEAALVARLARQKDTVPAEVAGVSVLGEFSRSPRKLRSSAFQSALAQALMPPQLELSDAGVREIEQFAVEQLGSLPPVLRVLLRIGLWGFRGYAFARTLRPFTVLGRDRQRALVESWAYGPVTLLRQLFRPIRSVVLLAFYEHPDVRAQLMRP